MPIAQPSLLKAPMYDTELSLLPMGLAHVAGLKAACACDREIWDLFPLSFLESAFEASLASILSRPGWWLFAILLDNTVIGMTSFVEGRDGASAVDIGATYLEPDSRGTGVNSRIKKIMIERARLAGFREVHFRIDIRNRRSMRAVEKLGARLEQVDRGDMRIWTGHLRDTAVFRLVLSEAP